MTNIYLVTSGRYSDYRVIAAFSTLALAREFKETFPSSDYNDVEVYEIDPPDMWHKQNGYILYIVGMSKDGIVESIRGYPAWGYTPTEHHLHGKPAKLISVVWAKSLEHAAKIVNEQRTRMIANGEWDESV